MFNPISSGVKVAPVQASQSTDLKQPLPSRAPSERPETSPISALTQISENEKPALSRENGANMANVLGSQTPLEFTPELSADVAPASLMTPEADESLSPPSELSRLIQDFNNKVLDQEAQYASSPALEGSDLGEGEAVSNLNLRL